MLYDVSGLCFNGFYDYVIVLVVVGEFVLVKYNIVNGWIVVDNGEILGFDLVVLCCVVVVVVW